MHSFPSQRFSQMAFLVEIPFNSLIAEKRYNILYRMNNDNNNINITSGLGPTDLDDGALRC